MVPGTWTQNTVDYTIYVYPSSGLPTAHAYRYAAKQYGIFTSNATASHVKIANLAGRMFANSFIMIGGTGDGNPHPDTAIYNVSSTLTGGRGIQTIGDRNVVYDSICSENGSEVFRPTGGAVDNAGCIVIEGISATSDDISMYDNLVYDTRNGSCAEINGTVNGLVYNNSFTGCGQLGVEIYGYAGAPSENNKVFRNGIDTIGAITLDPWATAIRFGNDSTDGLAYNNLVYGEWDLGLHPGAESYDAGFYNNTVHITKAITNTNAGGMVQEQTSATGNVFKNNLIYIPLGGKCLSTATGTDATFDTNLCWSPSGTPFRYRGTDYTSLISYQSAYTTATGLTDDSIYGSNPLLQPDYSLYQGSPAIGAGVDLSSYFTDDYYGHVRRGDWDIGAIESGVLESQGVGLSGMGVK
jgi:hypothetical protein